MNNGFFFWSLILLVPAFVLGIYAQVKVSSTFNRYSQIPSARGLTGARARVWCSTPPVLQTWASRSPAAVCLITTTRGRKVLTLSPEVGNSNSLAALGVAAHEAGHAMQHAEGYLAFRLRSAMVPVANIGTNFGFILFFIGLVFFRSRDLLMNIGILLYSAAVLFTVVTLPVEFNASSRAMNQLANRSILVGDELTGARKVLSAAALTYVAAALMAILQLVRLILISRRSALRENGWRRARPRGGRRGGGIDVRTAGFAGPHAPHRAGRRGRGRGGGDRDARGRRSAIIIWVRSAPARAGTAGKGRPSSTRRCTAKRRCSASTTSHPGRTLSLLSSSCGVFDRQERSPGCRPTWPGCSTARWSWSWIAGVGARDPGADSRAANRISEAQPRRGHTVGCRRTEITCALLQRVWPRGSSGGRAVCSRGKVPAGTRRARGLGLPLEARCSTRSSRQVDIDGLIALAGQRGFLSSQGWLTDQGSRTDPLVVVAGGRASLPGAAIQSRFCARRAHRCGVWIWSRIGVAGRDTAGLVLAGTLWPAALPDIALNMSLLRSIDGRIGQGLPDDSSGRRDADYCSTRVQDLVGPGLRPGRGGSRRGRDPVGLEDPAYVECDRPSGTTCSWRRARR